MTFNLSKFERQKFFNSFEVNIDNFIPFANICRAMIVVPVKLCESELIYLVDLLYVDTSQVYWSNATVVLRLVFLSLRQVVPLIIQWVIDPICKLRFVIVLYQVELVTGIQVPSPMVVVLEGLSLPVDYLSLGSQLRQLIKRFRRVQSLIVQGH